MYTDEDLYRAIAYLGLSPSDLVRASDLPHVDPEAHHTIAKAHILALFRLRIRPSPQTRYQKRLQAQGLCPRHATPRPCDLCRLRAAKRRSRKNT